MQEFHCTLIVLFSKKHKTVNSNKYFIFYFSKLIYAFNNLQYYKENKFSVHKVVISVRLLVKPYNINFSTLYTHQSIQCIKATIVSPCKWVEN